MVFSSIGTGTVNALSGELLPLALNIVKLAHRLRIGAASGSRGLLPQRREGPTWLRLRRHAGRGDERHLQPGGGR